MCRKCTNKVHKPNTLTAHLNAIRHKSKKNGLAFDLTADDLIIPAVCPVLGIPLHPKWGTARKTEVKDNSASVDRFVPANGYVKDNVRIISMRANRIKTDATLEEIGKLYQWLQSETRKPQSID